MAPEKKNDLSGVRLRGYAIGRLIGKGGMGEVYKAYEETLDRTVALKVLPPRLAEDESFTSRFLREAKSAAKLEHPGICPIYSAGEVDGVYYIAMQYVEGETLSGLLENIGSLPIEQALLVTRRVADALAFAHERDFIHRDIKPDNIMIDGEGRVKVMDFGLARRTSLDSRMTQTGMYVGTPEYSSPEQCETLDLDGRTDIYSLGVVLYEMLSGTVPHKAQTPYALFKKICSERPVPVQDLNPRLPDSVSSIVEKMLAKDREDRYASVRELISAIDATLRTLNIDSTAETAAVPVPGLASYTTEKMIDNDAIPTKPLAYSRKKKSLMPVLAAMVAVLVIGGWLLVANMPGENPEKIGGLNPINTPAAEKEENITPSIPEPKTEKADDTHKRPMKGHGRNTMPAGLVILDFDNLNDNPDIEWMRIGVADMFITDLAQCGFLRVVSREKLTGTLKELGTTQEKLLDDIRMVADGFGAEWLLKGGIVKIGSDVRINIKLLDAAGKILLADSALRQEEEFLGAVDVLSESLRNMMAGIARKKFPQAPKELFASEHDLTLEKQIFLADAADAIRNMKKLGDSMNARRERVVTAVDPGKALRETVPKAEFSEESDEKLDKENDSPVQGKSAERSVAKGRGGEGRPGFGGGRVEKPGDKMQSRPAPQEKRDLEGLSRRSKSKDSGGGYSKRAKEAPQSPGANRPEVTENKETGSHSDSDKKRETGRQERAGEELEKSRESGTKPFGAAAVGNAGKLTQQRKNFLAMRLYYSALDRFEKSGGDEKVLEKVLRDLKDALEYNPQLAPAVNLLKRILEEKNK